MKEDIPPKTRKSVFLRDNFTCQKCGFKGADSDELEIHHIEPKVFGGGNVEGNMVTLCSICHNFAPDSKGKFRSYLNEKIDGEMLKTFRKSQYSISKKTKVGMADKFKEGQPITRAPLGYIIRNKRLIVDPKGKEKVLEIFNHFLNNDVSLNQLARTYGYTVRGIKKLLTNKTYIGILKFDNQWHKGTHESIIPQEFFDKVQDKVDKNAAKWARRKEV